MSKHFTESVDRLLGIFQDIAEHADPGMGYSSRIPVEELEAVAASLVGRGEVSDAAVLRRESKRLERSIAGAGDPWGGQPTPEERREALETAVSGITRVLESHATIGKQLPPEHEEPAYLFRFEGAVYRVRFEGETGTVDAKLKGARYIYELLRHPNKVYPAVDLQAMGVSVDNEVKERRKLGHVSALQDLYEDGEIPERDSGKTDREMLREVLRGYRVRLSEIEAELDRAKSDNDEAAEHRLTTEKEGILAEIKRHQGLGGRLLRRLDGNENARSSVAKRIRGVITKCRSDWGLPRFAHHLDRIDCGGSLVYAPPAPLPDWHF